MRIDLKTILTTLPTPPENSGGPMVIMGNPKSIRRNVNF